MPRASTAKQKLTEAALGLIWTSGYGATSVDDICEKANVKKGSFYHFFKSKAQLEIAALEAHRQESRQWWNETFSPSVAPLERLENYFNAVLERQTELLAKFGSVLGCPLCAVGSEVSTHESAIREKAQELLECYVKYFESAIRDAHAEGSIVAPDAKTKARALHAYVLGVLTQARIANSLEPLRELREGGLSLLGVLPGVELAVELGQPVGK